MEEGMEQERLKILEMLAAGRIGAEEAAQLLEALEPAQVEVGGEAVQSEAPHIRPGGRWAHFWIYPLVGGGVLLALGALIYALIYGGDAARGWLVCGWLPMIFGAMVMLLAWWSRQARWLHLRISEQGRRRMAFSFPLPLGLTAWVLRIAQPFVPRLRETGADDLIIALRDNVTQDEPFYVDIQDDENGEHVEVYVG
jgi:hypothetical protein